MDIDGSTLVNEKIQKHRFGQFLKITKNYLKITFTFLLSSKLPKNYKKITSKIQNAPLRGAIGI